MADNPLGPRLRAARQRKGLSLRELASRIGVSPSLLSQVENGKSQASVTNLHSIVTALEITLDELFDTRARPGDPPGDAAVPGPAELPAPPRIDRNERLAPVQRPGHRSVLQMAGGVTWERLSWLLPQLIDVQLVTYEPGSASSSDGRQTRHNGTEFAYVMEGELLLRLGYEEYVLRAGDSLSFDSTTPHLYANRSTSPARGVWFEVGRRVAAGLDRDWDEYIVHSDVAQHGPHAH